MIGEEGVMVLPHWDTPQLYPEEKYADFKKPDMGKQICHYRSWVEACLGEGKNTDHFDYAGPLTEAALLGNIANQFPNETLKWDSEKLVFPGNEAATSRVRRTYRDGWDIPGLS